MNKYVMDLLLILGGVIIGWLLRDIFKGGWDLR